MKWIWHKECLKVLDILVEQGNDIGNIPVGIDSYKLENNELVVILRPGISPKDKYQLNAKKDCRNCRGYGWIRYCLDQDDIKSAPCEICFPDTKASSDWLRKACY